jgi:hypothetical protein
VTSDERLGIPERRVEPWDGVAVAAVAERDGRVAQQAAAPGAHDGAALESSAERRRVQRQDLGETWIEQIEVRDIGRLGVPRADVLADVAAEDPVADQGAQFRWYRAAMLDGEVRDTAAGIDPVVGPEGVGRAVVDTAPARAAVIRRRLAFGKLEAGDDLGEEERAPTTS